MARTRARTANMDIYKFLTIPNDQEFEVVRTNIQNKCRAFKGDHPSGDSWPLVVLEEGLEADIVLKASKGGGTVKAHQIVLAAASPVFHAKLSNNPTKHYRIVLDTTLEVLQLLLLLLYTTNDSAIPELNAAVDKHFNALYDAAHSLQMTSSLQPVLLAGMARNLTVENCMDYYAKAGEPSLLSEREVCMANIVENWEEVLNCDPDLMQRNQMVAPAVKTLATELKFPIQITGF